MPVPATPESGHDADTLDRAGYQVVFEEDFTGPDLAADRWVAHYLPQWSTPERSAARYGLDAGVLTLRIDADQPPWLPEDDQLRVSNIQTGSFSGPVGSDRGTHRHRPGLTVRTAQPTDGCTPHRPGWWRRVAGDRGPDVHVRGLAGGL
jgi:hypothetical protein